MHAPPVLTLWNLPVYFHSSRSATIVKWQSGRWSRQRLSGPRKRRWDGLIDSATFGVFGLVDLTAITCRLIGLPRASRRGSPRMNTKVPRMSVISSDVREAKMHRSEERAQSAAGLQPTSAACQLARNTPFPAHPHSFEGLSHTFLDAGFRP